MHAERPMNLVRLVTEELASSVMGEVGLDQTDQNKEDVLALALNSLPTKYVTTAQGKQYAKLVEIYRIQYETDVIMALTKAALKVKAHPRNAQ
jgi:competence protein ComFB